MASLKLIADEIAGALDRPFDDMFKERIKSIFRHEMATMIRQQLNKTGVDDQFKTRFSLVCKPSTPSDSPYGTLTLGNNWFRSENPIPKPIRYTTDDPFVYVGDPSGELPYIYTKLAEMRYTSLLHANMQNYQIGDGDLKLPHRYVYANDFIYVYYDNVLEGEDVLTELKLLVEGVFTVNPNITTSTIENNTAGIVYFDTMELPLPEDMIQLIKERLLKGELSITDDKDKITPAHMDNN